MCMYVRTCVWRGRDVGNEQEGGLEAKMGGDGRRLLM